MPNAIDVILILILAVIIGAAVAYVVKAKKNGAKCIGCSAGGACHCVGKNENEMSGCGCGCGCGGDSEDAERKEESACCCCQAEEK
ncbi:MAG: FeoB-associated Cys-rich membrane protein [Lachnospiraceae bacterium]|nr:FeoB-associated Cys-rich membrane protein [Lachnospiraceae bacterium]